MMDAQQVDKQPTERTDVTPLTPSETSSPSQNESKTRQTTESKNKIFKSKSTKCKAKAKSKASSKDKKKSKKNESSDESDTSEASDSDDSDSDSSSSESDSDRRRRRNKDKKSKKYYSKTKGKKSKRKSRRDVTSDSDSDDSDASEAPCDSNADENENADEGGEVSRLVQQLQLDLTDQYSNLQQQILQQQLAQPQLNLIGNATLGGRRLTTGLDNGMAGVNNTLQQLQDALNRRPAGQAEDDSAEEPRSRRRSGKSRGKRGSRLEFKRVDELWDTEIHNYRLKDTVQDDEASEYDQYVFTVRRKFDWEGKYTSTVLDIKSPLIKEALNDVMDGVKGVSLVEDTPVVDPNMVFLYLEDLRSSMKELKAKLENKKMKRKSKRRNRDKIQHVKVLVKYLDKDYANIKKTLYPMLESGLITFDLLWALFKPNTLIYTTTYGSPDEPRAFKVEYAEKEFSFMRGEWYNVEGRYLEYDGKTWGMGSMSADVPSFKGARKITSLACYPLKYHKDEAKVRAQLIERGKKFVSLQGVHFKGHEGLAYTKKKRQVIKVNINGRIMVDPAIHRRLLPNYPISTVKPSTDDDSDDDDSDCCCCSDDSDDDAGVPKFQTSGDDEPRTKTKLIYDEKSKKTMLVEVKVDEDGNEVQPENLEEIAGKQSEDEKENKIPEFSDEEYLIASPVVLGFSFGEKLWLEFTVSGIKDIVWNTSAYESLVIEPQTKEIVQALVQSHKYHATKSIDDVIQGKGKGLVAVLHGPPGTGKTLTAEGIGELLKCPVYMVSAGELGTDPRTLEGELQKILDIAHAWGAVLLLDEADVFLEKRTIQDIHRNALVSIFLRLLEYFQGILFLTTNRVETFDDAFQSRIHIALRYGDLSPKAKKSVFQQFIERVRVQEGLETMPFTDEDYNTLARHNLNGRQIKNTVRTAQALALNKSEPLAMSHIKSVLEVHMNFERDLKGGPGFEDAMRGYF